MSEQRRIFSALLAAMALAVMAYAAVPLVSSADVQLEGPSMTAFGPDCCRFSNECSGLAICDLDSTGCSAGAEHNCVDP